MWKPLVHVLADDTTAQQRRLGGALPAAGPQHLGLGRQTLPRAGALQLRPRRPPPPRRTATPGRLRLPVPGPRPDAGRHRRGGLAFVESRPLGGVWALDGLWRRLGIDQTMRRLLTGRRLDASAERVLFALVANRADRK